MSAAPVPALEIPESSVFAPGGTSLDRHVKVKDDGEVPGAAIANVGVAVVKDGIDERRANWEKKKAALSITKFMCQFEKPGKNTTLFETKQECIDYTEKTYPAQVELLFSENKEVTPEPVVIEPKRELADFHNPGQAGIAMALAGPKNENLAKVVALAGAQSAKGNASQGSPLMQQVATMSEGDMLAKMPHMSTDELQIVGRTASHNGKTHIARMARSTITKRGAKPGW